MSRLCGSSVLAPTTHCITKIKPLFIIQWTSDIIVQCNQTNVVPSVLIECVRARHYVICTFHFAGVPLSETAPTITSVAPLNQTCVEVRLEGPENGSSCFNNYTVEATCDGGSVVEGSVGGNADSSVLPMVMCPDRMCPNDPCTYTAYGQSQWFGMGHTSDPLQVQGIYNAWF